MESGGDETSFAHFRKQRAEGACGGTFRSAGLSLGGCSDAPSEIQERLRLKHRPTFRENYLRPAMGKGMIERTIPDKPNRRLQKYRLTDRGRTLLKEK